MGARHLTDETLRPCADAYRSGRSIRDIARSEGLSVGAVWHRLHRAGVRTRPRGPAPRLTREKRRAMWAPQRACDPARAAERRAEMTDSQRDAMHDLGQMLYAAQRLDVPTLDAIDGAMRAVRAGRGGEVSA